MSNRLIKVLQLLIILLIPVLIILGGARFLATDRYLAYEYGKAGFPPDPYGFTQRQRFILASTNIHYVRAHLPNDELSRQTMLGMPVYSAREVSHMADVRAVFQSVWRAWWIASIVILLSGFVLWRNGERAALAAALQSGGILTVALIGSIALLALFAWQVWFDNFHLIFFEPGSWLFAYSDTLIRLFPLQFWMDATFMLAAISFIGGSLLAFLGWRWRRSVISVTQIH